jgi:metal-sulfur cluster biosynthetic enzyme
MDPEIPISLVDLGLIYDVRRDGGTVEVDLTFTATACPCMAFIRFDIEERLQREPGVRRVTHPRGLEPRVDEGAHHPEGREAMKKFGVS